MNPRVELSCAAPHTREKLDELIPALDRRQRIAVIHHANGRVPAFLEFRRPSVWDNLGYRLNMIMWKKPNERSSTIQSVIDQNLFSPAHLQQAIADIEAGRTRSYEQFFQLHLFRKLCGDTLRWLPKIYLKLLQSKNTFEPALATMKPHLIKLREIARRGVQQDNQVDRPDIFFTSKEGERVYAHSQWLSGASSVRGLALIRQGPVECAFSAGSQFSKAAIHRFLDVVYGICPLSQLWLDECDAVYDVARALGYENLCDTIFTKMKNDLDFAIEMRNRPPSPMHDEGVY